MPKNDTGDPAHPKVNTINLSHKDGALLVGETDYAASESSKIMFGYWRYTAKFDDLVDTNLTTGEPVKDSDNQGVYTGISENLYKQKDDEKRGLDGFLRFGVANGSVNQVDKAVNGGVTYTGLFDSRPEDKLGLAVAFAHNGGSYKRAEDIAGTPADATETNFELTYRAELNKWITVQPDVQYFINPGTSPNSDNALIVGFHVEIGHGFGLL